MSKKQKMVVGDETGQQADLSTLEESNVAFDPTMQHLDLTKDEKRRVTALMLAIQANRDLIIKDAAYLEAAADLADRGKGPTIRPATAGRWWRDQSLPQQEAVGRGGMNVKA